MRLAFQLPHIPPQIIAMYLPKLIIDPVSLYLLFWLYYRYSRCELAVMVLILSTCCIFSMDTIWEIIPGILYVVFAFVILINTLKLERLEKEYRNTLLEKESLAYLEREGFATKKDDISIL